MNLVLQAGAVHLDGERLPGVEVNLVGVHVLDRLNPPAGDAGDGQRRRGGDRVIIRRLDDHRIGHDDELADGREA